jgi:cytochrome b
MESDMSELRAWHAWDAGIRWFHWINLLCVLGLIGLGLVILNAKTLGVSTDGKILLKTIHVWIGYLLALNLAWRLLLAFTGGPRARWRAILPGGRGYLTEVRNYLAGFRSGQSRQYIGHNPLGRLAVTTLLLLLTSQAVTGLVLAGTDLFMPPIGGWIAGWVAAPGTDPATLVPYAPQLYDEAAWEAMRAFREPFITVHYYGFYALLALILLHIVAVVVTELREGGNLVSAMITGRKMLRGSPADLQERDRETDSD